MACPPTFRDAVDELWRLVPAQLNEDCETHVTHVANVVMQAVESGGGEEEQLVSATRSPTPSTAAVAIVPAAAAPPPRLDRVRDARGQSLLHAALAHGNAVMVRHLLVCGGCDPHARSPLTGCTPLHACMERDADNTRPPLNDACVCALLECGARPDARGWGRATPLHVYARAGSERAVDCLLTFGAHVNARDARGWTPLHHAVDAQAVGIVQRLLRGGADVHARTHSSATLLARGQGVDLDEDDASRATYDVTPLGLVHTFAARHKPVCDAASSLLMDVLVRSGAVSDTNTVFVARTQ